MQEAFSLLAYAFGFGAAAVLLAFFRHRLNGTKPTVFHLLLASLVFEAIKLAARGASSLFPPSDWTQVEQFVACRAIYSFFHALSLPTLFVSILLSLQSLSAQDPHHTREKQGLPQFAVDALLVVLRLLLGLIRSSIFTASIYAIDVELVPQTGVSPELGSLDLLAITLVIFDFLLAVDISLRAWWLRRRWGRSNRFGWYFKLMINLVIPLLWLHTVNEIYQNSSTWARMWEEVSVETTTWNCVFRLGLSASFVWALCRIKVVHSSQASSIRLPPMPSDTEEEEYRLLNP